jgi:hypothetical protein
MWALVIFTIATTGVASSTVTSLEFATQHLCLVAEQQLESLTEPVVSEGLVRYTVVGTCVQVSEGEIKHAVRLPQERFAHARYNDVRRRAD